MNGRYRVFQGKYVVIEYDPKLRNMPIKIRRKSSGETFTFFALDFRNWMLEVLRIMLLRKMRPTQLAKFLWPEHQHDGEEESDDEASH